MRWLAKILFDERKSNSLKNQIESNGYILRFLQKLEFLFKNLNKKTEQFLAPRREEELSRGSILIEFAICMPIFIILLFYINDLVRIKRYYAQTEYMAQQFANIIQNISNGQRITVSHLRYASALSWLSLYPGKTMYHTDTRSSSAHELSHDPEFFIY